MKIFSDFARKPDFLQRNLFEDDASQPFTLHHPYPTTHLLDNDHDGTGEPNKPELTISKDSARLCIGRDIGGVIIRCAGDESRAKTSKQSFQGFHEAYTLVILADHF